MKEKAPTISAARPTRGRVLFLTRDSGGKHEMTPGQYVSWAAKEASRLGLKFSGTPAIIEAMIRDGRFHDGDIFLDYDVKGNELSRPGLNALLAEALTDKSVSHVFIPKRDRLARPDNAIDAMQLEAQFLLAGLTLVFQDRQVKPVAKGQRQNISDLIVSLIDYDHAAKERTDLATKILHSQVALAQSGRSTGGRPPYGFRRWLVHDDGRKIRELETGEHVRTRGQHVVWLPVHDDHPEMVIIRKILKLLRTTPAGRIARQFNAQGVPAPDSGRKRKDNGVIHHVSGLWHAPTVNNIARNPLLVAVCLYGRRSMGDQRRYSPDGPRVLNDADYRMDGKPKVVRNPDQMVHRQAASFPSVVDADHHNELIAILDKRGGTQRGKPRSRNPAMNPLGGRVWDMGCSWPMYRTPYKNSFRYGCGLYWQSDGAQCEHNQIDGPSAVRFLLGWIREKFESPRLMQKLVNRLQEIHGEQQTPLAANESQALQTSLVHVRADLTKAKRNLALADGEEQFRAVAAVFDDLKRQELRLLHELDRAQAGSHRPDLDAQVQDALKKLAKLPATIAETDNMEAVGNALRDLNVRLFLRFGKRPFGKRKVNKVINGVVTFGDAAPPITLYEGPTGRNALKATIAAAVAAGAGDDKNLPNLDVSGRQGESLGNVNRGDRI